MTRDDAHSKAEDEGNTPDSPAISDGLQASETPENSPETSEMRSDVGEGSNRASTGEGDASSKAGGALSIDQLIRRRGLISGWLIAWPFLVLTLIACAIAAFFQWMQRPQLVLFTIGLYLCMAFFAHAYSVAWQT